MNAVTNYRSNLLRRADFELQNEKISLAELCVLLVPEHFPPYKCICHRLLFLSHCGLSGFHSSLQFCLQANYLLTSTTWYLEALTRFIFTSNFWLDETLFPGVRSSFRDFAWMKKIHAIDSIRKSQGVWNKPLFVSHCREHSIVSR